MWNRFAKKLLLSSLLACNALSFAGSRVHVPEKISTGFSLLDNLSRQLLDAAPTDAEIEQLKAYYQRAGKRELEHYLSRAEWYFPVFEPYLKNAQIPDILKILPIVESGLDPEATSPRGAVGLWQFMPSTARHYGLVVHDLADERKNVQRSTQAAAHFLSELQGEFNNWLLVLAAYNCGPGKVRRAIRQTGSRDYASLKNYLPRQTRRYISKFIAIAQIACDDQQPSQEGQAPLYAALHTPPDAPAAELKMPAHTAAPGLLHLKGNLSIRELALKTGIPAEAIFALNPSLTSDKLPYKKLGWNLYLPREGVNRYFRQQGEENRLAAL